MINDLKTKKFISESILVHNDIYDYSLAQYINYKTPITIICKKHKEFKVLPKNHTKGKGFCPDCYAQQQFTATYEARIGELKLSNAGYLGKIIEYFNAYNCTIQFEDGNIVKGIAHGHFKRSCFKNHFHPSVFGVGYFGVGKYSKNDNPIIYQHWQNMLGRCYNEKDRRRTPTYIDIEVCSEWKCFQNFAEWFEEKYESHMQGWQLDKDILVKGNKVYSSETSCLIPRKINALFIKSNKARGKYPIGVSFCKSQNKFKSGINNYYHNTPEEAFNSYKIAKEIKIKQMADEWKLLIEERVYQALYNYQVEITD